ncbi:MAG: helix-turn-helix domain-containing protein [Myxococcota bacterium]
MGHGALHSETIGDALRAWRKERGMSQLRLATEAEVSTRHLSYVETGRAQASRELLLVLFSVLELPLRERNVLLQRAGYATAYGDAGLDDPAMAKVRDAVEFLLEAHEPNPVVVFDRHWRLQLLNRAARRLFEQVLGPLEPGADVLELVLSPKYLRKYIVNFDQVAGAILSRVIEESRQDRELKQRLERLEQWMPTSFSGPALGEVPDVLVPLRLAYQGLELALFTTLTTLGTPTDATAQELRIETYFPADEPTKRVLEMLAAAEG